MKERTRTAKAVWGISCVIWIAETAYFLIRDGWHWKAACAEEKALDNLVSTLLAVAVFLYLRALYMALCDLLDRLID